MQSIPGFFSSESQQQSAPFEGMENSQGGSENDRVILLPGRSLLQDLLSERERLDSSYVHCNRLLDKGRNKKSNAVKRHV